MKVESELEKLGLVLPEPPRSRQGCGFPSHGYGYTATGPMSPGMAPRIRMVRSQDHSAK